MYQDRNPAVVISQHVTAPPPAIADRKPELSRLGPVLSKALAKSPGDRYDTCMDFANALARHLDVVAPDLGANDATMAAAAMAAARRHRTSAKSRMQSLVVPSAILIGLAIAGAAAPAILIGRHQSEAVPHPIPSAPAAPAAPAAPVVLIGADCEVLGAAGVTETGEKAYCARLPSTENILWSLYQGVVPAPTIAPGPNDPVYPAGIEEQVRVCIQETGQTRPQCREDIRRGNLYGPP
jgi:serine/threonine protein kinase, bacterial